MNTLTPEMSVAERLYLRLPRLTFVGRENDRIADLGLDSLDTVELLCVVHEEFGVRLTESDFFLEQTMAGLLAAIGSKATSNQSLA